MTDCASVATPLPIKTHPTVLDLQPFPKPHLFRSLIGGLQYLTLTRPDLSYSVNSLCQKMHSPTNGDFKLLKRILRYVKGTQHLGLFLHSHSTLKLYGYADSDWAGCSQTRRSTSGVYLFLGSNLISWSAKRQLTVSRSSTEAEYRALASATADITWTSFVLRDLGISLSGPTPLYSDNRSAIALTANPVLHARTKHVEIDFHFVREKVALHSLVVSYVPAYYQLADIFTKALPRADHFRLRIKLGLGVPPTLSLRGANNPQLQISDDDARHSDVTTSILHHNNKTDSGTHKEEPRTAHNIPTATCPKPSGSMHNRFAVLTQVQAE